MRMKGLELSREFYLRWGKDMLHDDFSDIESSVAVGFFGSGSECFGFDDSISTDHDFEPGFCLLVADDVSEERFFQLHKAYRRLPDEFMGYKRSTDAPVGGSRHGAFRISDYFINKIGSPDGVFDLKDWFLIPEQSLAEATNGEIFRDDKGIVTEIRERISYFPEDVRLKKIAGNLLVMGQAGQYNYRRCTDRGDTAAAQLCIIEFVKSAMNTVFLINKKYAPYYKWSFRAMKELDCLQRLDVPFEYLISSPNTEEEVPIKLSLIEEICREITGELRKRDITRYSGNEAEGHAYWVNNKITDPNIRNLHILYGI